MLFLRVALLLLSLVAPVLADVIVLVNGNEIRGEIVERSEDRIRVRLPLGEIEIPTSQIREIRIEGEAASRIGQARDLAADRSYGHALRWLDEAEEHGADRSEIVKARNEILLAQARFLSSRGSFPAADRALTEALDIDPGSTEARREKELLENRIAESTRTLAAARSALAGGDPDTAIQALDALTKRWPALGLEISTDLFDALVARGDRRLLTERDPPAAHADYDRALRLEPRRRIVLESRWTTTFAIGLLNGALTEGNASTALPEIADADANFPGHPLLAFLQGLALEELDRDGEARRAYRDGLVALDPEVSPPGSIEEARERLRQQLQLDPGVLRFREENERWSQAAAGQWQELPTTHFRIKHRNPYVARRVAIVLERSFDTISAKLVPGRKIAWGRPCEVVLHPDGDSYLEATGQPPWSGGVTQVRSRGPVLLAQRIATFQTASGLLSSVVPHEVTHTLIPAIFGYGHPIETWVQEGLAVRAEDPVRQARLLRQLRIALAAGGLGTLEEIAGQSDYPDDPDRVDLFYGASYALIDFLLERGSIDDLVRFTVSTEGTLFERLREIYDTKIGENPIELEERWAGHVRQMHP